MKSTFNFPIKLPALRNKQDTDIIIPPTKEEVTDIVEKNKMDAIRVLRIWLNEDKKVRL